MRRKNLVLTNIAVTGLAAEGKAVAKAEGKVIFIQGAIPGDLVDIQLLKSKKDWAEAKIIKIIEPSPDRITPFCGHFGVCGGCKWQMLPYPLQLKYKQDEVLQNLIRLGKIELPAPEPIIAADPNRYYRNKLEFTFSNKRYRTPQELSDLPSGIGLYELPEEPALGFHVPKLFDKVLDIQTCYLMQEPTNAIRNEIKRFVLEKGYPFYDIKNHTGWLRNLVLRIAGTGEIMLNLVIAYDRTDKTVLLEHIHQKFPEITALLYTVNPKFNDSIYDLEPMVYYGKSFITEQLEGFRFMVSAKSFFQTNTRQAEKLYQVTRSFAELTGRETVYDLYCGTGSIGIFCSKNAKKLIGVESIAEAIADADANARFNQIENCSFFAGDVVDICTDAFFEQHGKPDVIITDPPRAGMHQKLIEKIIEIKAPLIVYVSCNSATQARDLQLLDACYAVKKLQPVDMFPHTHHIENVVQLKLR
jgi:23S rRNA (uracil1939-C5)-methyltransferase